MGKKSRLKKLGRNVGAEVSGTEVKLEKQKLLQEIVKKGSAKLSLQDKRIFAVLGVEVEEQTDVNEETLRRYLEYLKENIELPCIVTGREDFRWEEYYVFGPGNKKEYEQLKKTRPSYTDEFKIINFYEDSDDTEGIFVNVQRLSDKKKFDLPLADLEPVDESSKNVELLDDYCTWFVNHR